LRMGERAMSEEEVRLQATRVAGLLRESWSEELADAELEPNAMGGLALAEALVRGWIEPDPSMAPFLATAEEALGSFRAGGQGQGGDYDE
jgi:hypothetical protein